MFSLGHDKKNSICVKIKSREFKNNRGNLKKNLGRMSCERDKETKLKQKGNTLLHLEEEREKKRIINYKI